MSDEQIKALAKDLVDNLVDCGSADDEAIEQYLLYTIVKIKRALKEAKS